jgi:hypothetical protein
VDRETEQVVTSEFDFTGMETTSNSESKLSSAPRDGLRAADRSSGAIEGRNDSIAGALHETPNP